MKKPTSSSWGLISTMEKEYIRKLKSEIEEKLSWKQSADWKQRDYEYLGEIIYEKTQILLSVSTLKRIWASEVKTVPHLSTLNALAKYAGYNDWYDYKKKSGIGFLDTEEKLPSGSKASIILKRFLPKIVVALILFFTFYMLFFNSSGKSNFEEVTFTSKKVVKTEVPNTVIFNYDISMIKADSFFIQQSWDSRMRGKINPANHQFTSIYYYPGVHRAKLYVNDEMVKEHFVHINTDGWLPLVRYELNQLIPIYLPGIKFMKDGRLYLSKEELSDYDIPVNEKDYFVEYYNVRDFNNLSGDDFTLETKVKSPVSEGADACGDVIVIMLCEYGRQAVNIGTPGCAANFSQKVIDGWIRGRENDLSMFGCDMNSWNKIIFTAKNHKVTFSLNDKKIYETEYKKTAGRLYGIHYMFHKTGSVDYVKLKNGKNEIVYEDDFLR